MTQIHAPSSTATCRIFIPIGPAGPGRGMQTAHGRPPPNLLGWFSIGLGMAEILASRAVSKLIGL